MIFSQLTILLPTIALVCAIAPGLRYDAIDNELGYGAVGPASRYDLTKDMVLEEGAGSPGISDARMSDPASIPNDAQDTNIFPKEFLDSIPVGLPNDTADVIPGRPFTLEELNYKMTQQDNSQFDQMNGVTEIDAIQLANAFEGDIRLRSLSEIVGYGNKPAGNERGEEPSKEPSRNAIMEDRKWRNNKIPYLISKVYSNDERRIIANAVKVFNTKTCLSFEPRLGEQDYILIYKGRDPRNSGCSSFVGKLGGKQTVTIGNGCVYPGIVMHELMHAVGFWHEQSRPDRDQYIEVLFHNVLPGMKHNFHKSDKHEVQTLELSYDYGSIMHYGRKAFAKNRKYDTIKPRNTHEGSKIGQRTEFSQLDLQKINKLYNCNAGVVQPVTPTIAPITGSASCNNRHKHCEAWSKTGECDSNPIYMKEKCPLACKTCPKGGKRDMNEHCAYWASKGECENNSDYMHKQCQLSCNVGSVDCVDDDKTCGFWAKNGECYKNSRYMHVYCKKSCNICGRNNADREITDEAICVDNDAKCDYWGEHGFCLTHDNIKNTHCRKTCGVC